MEPTANCCPDELVLLNYTMCCTALLLVVFQLNVKYQTNRCGSSKDGHDVTGKGCLHSLTCYVRDLKTEGKVHISEKAFLRPEASC